VDTYTIGEIAVRSGFSTSALRFYEGIGLVSPASRTAARYRMYDDRTLDRLAFITRAKQLGCSLEEITDLVGIWDRQQCGPVQARFHTLVTDKLHATRRQITELEAFTTQLHSAAKQLAGQPTDGPCGDDCACVADTPIACTLETAALPDRIADWKRVLAHARSQHDIDDNGLRIEFDAQVPLGDLVQLVGAEQQCCSFLSFAITVDVRGVALEVRGPEGAVDMVTVLFGDED
jgi:DNA-binding transcriptional MerR regulator